MIDEESAMGRALRRFRWLWRLGRLADLPG